MCDTESWLFYCILMLTSLFPVSISATQQLSISGFLFPFSGAITEENNATWLKTNLVIFLFTFYTVCCHSVQGNIEETQKNLDVRS